MKTEFWSRLSILKRVIVMSISFYLIFFSGSSLYGESHLSINESRSSGYNDVFVSQSIEGMYGKVSIYGRGLSETGQVESFVQNELWKGYSLRNMIGLEVMKFLQFGLSHSLVSMRSTDNVFARLDGSKLMAEGRMVFSSPIGNVEVGGGAIGGILQMQRELERFGFAGSGYFYGLGLNYFMSSRVSAFMHARVSVENYERDSGNEVIKKFRANTNQAGFGVSVWL